MLLNIQQKQKHTMAGLVLQISVLFSFKVHQVTSRVCCSAQKQCLVVDIGIDIDALGLLTYTEDITPYIRDGLIHIPRDDHNLW